jgi:hypothetical protein
MVLIFFTGTTGFTLYIHICSCFNTTKYAFFHELAKTKPTCCCEEKNTNSPDLNTYTTIKNSECCQNKHLLIKSTTYMQPVITKFSEDKTFKLLTYYIPTKTIFTSENKVSYKKLASHYFPPPLLSGRLLVISYNQIKVPLSV